MLSGRGFCDERSSTECGVPECDRESLIMRRPWPTGSCWAMLNIHIYITYIQQQCGPYKSCGYMLKVDVALVVPAVRYICFNHLIQYFNFTFQFCISSAYY
jgi:hypothetical protein